MHHPAFVSVSTLRISETTNQGIVFTIVCVSICLCVCKITEKLLIKNCV